MRKIYFFLVALLAGITSTAQCPISTTSFGSGAAPVNFGDVTDLTFCAYAGEYQTINSCVNGIDYEVTSTGGAGNYLTIYDNLNVPVAFGFSPVPFTATYDGVYYSMPTVDLICSSDLSCHALSVENVGPPPACLPTANLNTTNLIAAAADLGWDVVIGAVDYNVEWGFPGFIPGVGGQQGLANDVVPNTINITGLTPGTSYEFYVEVDCGGGNFSTWAGPYVFNTPNLPIQPPVGFTCTTGNAFPVFSDDMETGAGWTGDLGIANGTWDFPTANPGGNSGGTGPSGPQSGTTFAEYEASGNVSTIASMVSPAIDLTAGNDFAELTFWMHAFGDDIGTLNVGVGTSATGPFTTEFTHGGNYQLAAADPWEQIGISLDAYVGQTIFVEFSYGGAGTGFEGDLAIDLVEVSTCVTCVSPSNLNLLYAVDDSAIFNWDFGFLEAAWEFDYGVAGFTPGTGSPTTTNATQDTITGLAPNEFYEIYVRADCGIDGYSGWLGPISFNTYDLGATMEFDAACPTSGFVDISLTGADLMLTDDSEAGLTLPFPFLFQGSTVTDVTIGNNGGMIVNTQVGNVGYTMTSGDGLYPFVQDLDNDIGGVATQGVYYETLGTAPNRTFVVMWKDRTHWSGASNLDPCTFELMIEEESQEIYYVYEDVDFSNPAYDFGADAEIGVRGLQDLDVSLNDPTYLIDNSCVHFYYTDCPKPTGLVSTYVGIDTIIFDFVAGGAETEWQVEYGPTGFTPGSGTTFETMTTTDTISGLIQLTTYDIYITAICGVGDSSKMVGPMTVTTAPVCANPSVLTVDFASSDSAGISWTNNGTAVTWNIQYGVSGFSIGSGTVQASMTNPDTLTGLVSGNVYDVYVQANCGAPDTSEWIGPVQVFAPIPNDTVCGAINVPVDGTTYNYHNIGSTSAGEPGLTPNNTVWFAFTAPASGAVTINTCGVTFDNELEVFEGVLCSDPLTSVVNAAANPFNDCLDNQSAGVELCGLNPGQKYFMWIGAQNGGNFGEIPLTITEVIFPEAGTAVAIEVCANETALDLFTGTTGNVSSDGTWYNPAATAGNELPNIIDVTAIPAGTYPIFYVDVDACLSDTVESTLTVVDLPNVGMGSTIDAGCNYNSVSLADGLSGTIDFGGTWYDESSNTLTSSLVTYDGEPAGSYDYYYVVDNGVCAADTATVTVDVIDCASIGENTMGLNVYPNPVQDVLTINLSNVSASATVQLFDLQGSFVSAPIAINSTSVNVNMADYADGVYILKVTSNGATEEVRVVKQ
jgi:Secretion system C-terminal sorting domain